MICRTRDLASGRLRLRSGAPRQISFANRAIPCSISSSPASEKLRRNVLPPRPSKKNAPARHKGHAGLIDGPFEQLGRIASLRKRQPHEQAALWRRSSSHPRACASPEQPASNRAGGDSARKPASTWDSNTASAMRCMTIWLMVALLRSDACLISTSRRISGLPGHDPTHPQAGRQHLGEGAAVDGARLVDAAAARNVQRHDRRQSSRPRTAAWRRPHPR